MNTSHVCDCAASFKQLSTLPVNNLPSQLLLQLGYKWNQASPNRCTSMGLQFIRKQCEKGSPRKNPFFMKGMKDSEVGSLEEASGITLQHHGHALLVSGSLQ